MLTSLTMLFASALLMMPSESTPSLFIGEPNASTRSPGPGDRVLAFGSPMNKLGVLSLGIISNADANSIVSDVSIGWQNTGGPLVSRDGYVIGLTSDKGATNSGGGRTETSVAAPVLMPALGKARDSLP